MRPCDIPGPSKWRPEAPQMASRGAKMSSKDPKKSPNSTFGALLGAPGSPLGRLWAALGSLFTLSWALGRPSGTVCRPFWLRNWSVWDRFWLRVGTPRTQNTVCPRYTHYVCLNRHTLRVSPTHITCVPDTHHVYPRHTRHVCPPCTHNLCP